MKKIYSIIVIIVISAIIGICLSSCVTSKTPEQALYSYIEAMGSGDAEAAFSFTFSEYEKRLDEHFGGLEYIKSVELKKTIELSIDVAKDVIRYWPPKFTKYEEIQPIFTQMDIEWEANNMAPMFGFENNKVFCVFLLAKDNGVWKIFEHINAINVNTLVEKGILPCPETVDGELSVLELRLLSERFSEYVYVLDQNGVRACCFSEVNGMFKSYYDDPKYLDLSGFLETFPKYTALIDRENEEFDVAIELLEEQFGYNFGLGESYIKKIKKKDVDEVLKKYADIIVKDLKGGLDKKIVYSEKYDSYYLLNSSVSGGHFSPESGKRDGDIYTLYEHKIIKNSEFTAKLVLKKNGDDYKILSHSLHDSML